MRRVLKWIGIGVGALLTIVVLGAGAMYMRGSSRLAERYETQTATLSFASDADLVERGEHLAQVNGCTDCHTPGLGGQIFVDAPPFLLVAPNLTPGEGGVGSNYSPERWDRAIRHGVGHDGRPLQIMPSAAFHNLADEDMIALIAYLEQLPAIDNVLPASEFRTLGKVLSGFAMDPGMEVNLEPARSTRPAAGPTQEYGAYLTSITCQYCHGPDLRGAQPATPGSPPAPNLAAAGQWPMEGFKTALRTGRTPGGRQLDAEFMPYTFTAHMTDEELEAVKAHLATLIDAAPSPTD